MDGTEGAEGMEGMEGVDGIEGVLTEGTDGVLTEGMDGVSSDGVLTGLFNVGVFMEGVCPDKRLRNRMPAIAVLLVLALGLPSVPTMVMKSGKVT